MYIYVYIYIHICICLCVCVCACVCVCVCVCACIPCHADMRQLQEEEGVVEALASACGRYEALSYYV